MKRKQLERALQELTQGTLEQDNSGQYIIYTGLYNEQEMQIEIEFPDDFHVHLRQDDMLCDLVKITSTRVRHATVMPNTVPPIKTVQQAEEYRTKILEYSKSTDFTPHMTIYLTDDTCVDEIKKAADTEWIIGAKLYPTGATTNSDRGVSSIEAIGPVLETMQDVGLPLLIHGEVTDPEVDFIDRERVFITRVLRNLVHQFKKLHIVLEHVSTAEGVHFVIDQRAKGICIDATVTPQHMLLTRNDLFTGGLKPLYYCLPVVQTEKDRIAILQAVTSGHPAFFAGTDSAPHPANQKISQNCSAGIFSAPYALVLYAHAFFRFVLPNTQTLKNFTDFLSVNGKRSFGLSRTSSTRHCILTRSEQAPCQAPYDIGLQQVFPFCGRGRIDFKTTGA